MKITVRYFASIREALATSTEPVDSTATTAGALRLELAARGGAYAQALGPARVLRMALDQTLCAPDAALHEGCELAFFPPVTGG